MIPWSLCLLSLLLVVSALSIPSDHELVFDENDPFTSHPEIQEVITEIFDRHIRRGLTLPDELDDTDRQKILDMLNTIRLETAKGEFVGHLPKACNMKKLKWSKALETMATDWAAKCPRRSEGEPDFELWNTMKKCHRSSHARSSGDPLPTSPEFMKTLHEKQPSLFEWKYQKYQVYGENIQMASGKPAIDDIVTQMYTHGWGQEEAKITVWDKIEFGAGHFTQNVWADTEYVGCGFRYCSEFLWKTVFVCNYYPAGNRHKKKDLGKKDEFGKVVKEIVINNPFKTGEPGTCCADGFDNDGEGLCIKAEGKSKIVGGSASSSSVSMHSPRKKKEIKSVKPEDTISVHRDKEPRKVRYGPPVTKKKESFVDKSRGLKASTVLRAERMKREREKKKRERLEREKEKKKKLEAPPKKRQSSHLGLNDAFDSEEVANVNGDGYVWMRMDQQRYAQMLEVMQWSYVALAFIILIALGVCFVFGAAFVGCLGFGVYYKRIAKTEHSFDFV